MNDTLTQIDGSPHEDIALTTLMAVAREVAPDFPEDVVHGLYALQKRHQFDSDRSGSIQEMQRFLEAHVQHPGNRGTQ